MYPCYNQDCKRNAKVLATVELVGDLPKWMTSIAPEIKLDNAGELPACRKCAKNPPPVEWNDFNDEEAGYFRMYLSGYREE